MEKGAQKQETQNKKVARRLLGKTFLLFFKKYNLQRLQSKQEESTEEEEMKQQQRMKIMKDLTKKIRSKGRMNAKNRWWVAEIWAADCEKAWIHTGWEDTMQKWYNWLEEMKKKDEKEQMKEMHILEKDEDDARLLERCEAKRKEWSIHWQRKEEVQNMKDKPWKIEELRRWEEALPRLKECDLEKTSRMYKAKTEVGCDGFHPKVPLDLTKETRGEIVELLEKGGAEWQMAQTGLRNDVLPDPEECYE